MKVFVPDSYLLLAPTRLGGVESFVRSIVPSAVLGMTFAMESQERLLGFTPSTGRLSLNLDDRPEGGACGMTLAREGVAGKVTKYVLVFIQSINLWKLHGIELVGPAACFSIDGENGSTALAVLVKLDDVESYAKLNPRGGQSAHCGRNIIGIAVSLYLDATKQSEASSSLVDLFNSVVVR